jgi:hypothetical protein
MNFKLTKTEKKKFLYLLHEAAECFDDELVYDCKRSELKTEYMKAGARAMIRLTTLEIKHH